MKRFKEFLSEAYSFFPKSVEEIETELKDFSTDSQNEIKALFTFLKTKYPSVYTPINIDKKKQNNVNVTRELQSETEISDIVSGAGIKKIKLKFGNGSSGNRGVNNRGNMFEGAFATAITTWWNGEEVENKSMLAAIKDLDKTYKLSDSSKLDVNVVGGENTKRPLKFGPTIILDNPKGSGFDIGKSVTDVTLVTDNREIYLSLKLGTTTTFFNVGVRRILSPDQIKSGKITNKDGLNLLSIFGIDPVKFTEVFNGTSKGSVDTRAKVDSNKIEKLLQSGIGYNYHIIHKMSKGILSKQMNQSAMKKAAKITGGVTVYYGGKTGRGKRVDVEFKSASYKFKINIRDTQGKDGYPTRMMCDFTTIK